MNKKLMISIVMMGMALQACTSSRALNTGLQPLPAPTPLPAAPSGQVQSTDMSQIQQSATTMSAQPPVEAPTAPTTIQNATPTSTPSSTTQMASLEKPKPKPTPITRNGMAGVWTVPTDGGGCRIMLAFTKSTSGYRAANKSCNSSEVQSISEWDVSGQQVVLTDRGGNTVARLYSSGGGRYDGTTSSGKAISFRR